MEKNLASNITCPVCRGSGAEKIIRAVLPGDYNISDEYHIIYAKCHLCFGSTVVCKSCGGNGYYSISMIYNSKIIVKCDMCDGAGVAEKSLSETQQIPVTDF